MTPTATTGPLAHATAGLRRRAAVLALTAAVLSGCGGSNTVRPEDPPPLVDLQVGTEVTVTAQVAALQSPRAFTIIDEEGGGGEPLLVVHPELPEPVSEEFPVTVTGTVGIFDADRVVVEALDPARLLQYDGEPYIAAVEVTALDPE